MRHARCSVRRLGSNIAETEWHTPRHRNEAHIRSLGVHPDAPERVVAGVEVGGVHVSDDSGETWTERRNGVHDDVHHVFVLGAEEYIASCGGGLYRTRDSGESWTRLDGALDHTYFREAFADEGRLYAAAARGPPGTWGGANGADAALFESTDGGTSLDETCRMAAQARNINSGQSCIAAKRFIVHEDIYHDFLDGFSDEMQRLQVGDPMDSETNIGPQARMDLMETLHEQVQQSVDGGAEVHLGGEPLDREGSFYPPTILTDVPTDTPVATEEVFGPVAPVFTVENEDQAIELANSSHLGLGASVWTDDLKHGEHIARRLEAGATFVNEFVKSDPRLPFGGVKDSGYGRELSRHGIREFVNRKTLWIQHGVGDDEALIE
jgi:hypothetical protein